MDDGLPTLFIAAMIAVLSWFCGAAVVAANSENPTIEQRQQLVNSCTIDNFEPACKALEN